MHSYSINGIYRLSEELLLIFVIAGASCAETSSSLQKMLEHDRDTKVMMNELIRDLWLDFMVMLTLSSTVFVATVILGGSGLLLNNTIYVD